MNNKKKLVLNIALIFIALSIVLYFSLKDNYEEILYQIGKMDWKFFIIGIILFITHRILLGTSMKEIVILNKEKISLKKSTQISLIIPFFNGITPFATGGQPMEVYYLHKENIEIPKATNIVLQNFILAQIATISIGIFSIIYNQIFQIFPEDSIIKKLVILGFCVNVLVLILSTTISFSKKINKFILNNVINFLNKIKIIKDKERTKEKLSKYLDDFCQNTKILLKNKSTVLRIIVLDIIAYIIYYSIAFFISCGLGTNNINYIESIVAVAYTMMIGSFIPIPGATGGIEYGFTVFYGSIVKENIVTSIMLLWRFITYYLAMIIGAINLAFYRKKELK